MVEDNYIRVECKIIISVGPLFSINLRIDLGEINIG